MSTEQRFWTVAEIARALGQQTDRINRVIRALRLKPFGHSGNARVFRSDDLEVILSELRRLRTRTVATMSSHREGDPPCQGT